MKKLIPLLALSLVALCSCGSSSSGVTSDEKSLQNSNISSLISEEESSISLSNHDTVESGGKNSEDASYGLEDSSYGKEDSSFVESSSEELPHLDPYSLYGGYYVSLSDWENGEDLLSKLHEIIHGGTYTPITYAGTITNWFSNQDADEYLYDHAYVDVVYSKDNVLKEGTNTYWQREHAFCASLMTGTTTANAVKTLGRATDFHNLFASNASGNSSRGNKNFGTADKSNPDFVSRLSDNGNDGYCFDPEKFEPGNKDKGRLSRAIFYMATMYSEDEYDSNSGITMKGLRVVEGNVPYVAGNDCAFAIGNLSTLLSWSDFDVDLSEYQHNESVYSFVPEVHSDSSNNKAQGNRNPYVDFPGLVDYAFGSKKDVGGSLQDVVSSYEMLDIGGEGTAFYAINEAKRQYDQDEEFHLTDLSVHAIGHDLSETVFDGFTVEGAEDGQPIEAEGQTTLTVKTPINDISYSVLVETDPIESATWKHKITAKSEGNDFYGIANQPGVVHKLDFDGVEWNVTYAAGTVESNSAALGCKFGKAAGPVQMLTFETSSAFSFNGLSSIEGIFLRGCASSGNSYNVSMYVGETSIGSYSLGYVDTKTPLTVGKMLSSPLEGKIKISITNVTNAVYVQYLAVHAS